MRSNGKLRFRDWGPRALAAGESGDGSPRLSRNGLAVIGLMALGLMICAYFQGLLGLEVVYAHLYYLPILFAVYLWQWRGLWMAGLLGLILLGGHLVFLGDAPVFADAFRAVMFVLIGAVFAFFLGLLRRQNAQLMENGQELSRRLEFVFDLTNVCSQPGKSPRQMCRELIAVWPESLGGAIELNGEKYATGNYRETPWHLHAPIIVRNREAGWIKMDYLARHGENRHRNVFLRDTQLLTIMTKEMRACIERFDVGRELLKMSESEQMKIGRDLHDGLGQVLTGISLMFEVLSMDMRKESLQSQELLNQINEKLEEAIMQTRMMSYGLCPVDMNEGGLYRSLRGLAEKTRRILSIDCEFVCETPELISDATTAGHLFRIAQEAVASAIHHCKARQIRIELNAGDGQVVLTIWDNGDRAQAHRHETYELGVELMKYRACLIEAELEIKSDPRLGSQVICQGKLCGDAIRRNIPDE